MVPMKASMHSSVYLYVSASLAPIRNAFVYWYLSVWENGSLRTW